MLNKKWKIPALVLGAILAVILVYVIYLLIGFIRLPDNQTLKPQGEANVGQVLIGNSYTIASHNIGFGAYTSDFTFFMDGGKESRAESAESVKNSTAAMAEELKKREPQFILLQEVDTNSTRSHHVNQKEQLEGIFEGYTSVFGVNYHSPYLIYPITEPVGASNSGLMTLSEHQIKDATCRRLPISWGFGRFVDLDRCYTVSRFPVENGKELVVYNVHLSAYGNNERIRTAQVEMLMKDMKAEFDQGNYCIAGGDFNHDFTGNSIQMLNNEASADFSWAQPFPEKLIPKGISRVTNYAEPNPSCRNCDVPYEPGNFTVIVDGFMVSDNVAVEYVNNVDCGFAYSDHNPVVMDFVLKD